MTNVHVGATGYIGAGGHKTWLMQQESGATLHVFNNEEVYAKGQGAAPRGAAQAVPRPQGRAAHARDDLQGRGDPMKSECRVCKAAPDGKGKIRHTDPCTGRVIFKARRPGVLLLGRATAVRSTD